MAEADRATVAVIGAGPAGCAAAIRLARAGCTVSLVESGDAAGHKIGDCLPPSSKPLLEELGVWHAFSRAGHRPSYGNLSAWGAAELAERDFIFDPEGNGWHLDRPRFEAMLREAAVAAGAKGRPRTRLSWAAPERAGAWRLHLLADGVPSVLEAECVVDATGRASLVARAAGARRHSYDGLIGAACLLTLDAAGQEPDARTLVEAVASGWWYSAVVPAGLLAVFMTDADLPSARAAHAADGWMTLLAAAPHTAERARALGVRAGAAPRMAAASSTRLDLMAGEGWLAVGDAAATYDPLSSRGITTALASGIEAADAVLRRLGGDVTALQRYAQGQREDYLTYLAGRTAHYAQERRWTGSPFWRRRDPSLRSG